MWEAEWFEGSKFNCQIDMKLTTRNGKQNELKVMNGCEKHDQRDEWKFLIDMKPTKEYESQNERKQQVKNRN